MGVEGAGCRAQGAGFRVHLRRSYPNRGHGRSAGTRCSIRYPNKVQGSGFKGSGFRVVVYGSELRVQGAGCRVQGSDLKRRNPHRGHGLPGWTRDSISFANEVPVQGSGLQILFLGFWFTVQS